MNGGLCTPSVTSGEVVRIIRSEPVVQGRIQVEKLSPVVNREPSMLDCHEDLWMRDYSGCLCFKSCFLLVIPRDSLQFCTSRASMVQYQALIGTKLSFDSFSLQLFLFPRRPDSLDMHIYASCTQISQMHEP